MFNSKIRKNRKELLAAIEKCIDQADTSIPSCKTDLMVHVKKLIEESKDELATFSEETDYEKISFVFLSNLAFQLLSTGSYHFHSGRLTLIGEGIRRVFKYSQKWALDKGLLSQEDYMTNIEAFNENIKSVG
jgi:hypothetical protein